MNDPLERALTELKNTVSANAKPKSKRQFSKGHVIFADALVFVVFFANVILSFFDKVPISDVASVRRVRNRRIFRPELHTRRID